MTEHETDARARRRVATNREALSALRLMRVKPDGLTPVTMRGVGFTGSQKRAAHVEWSPHLEGDAAVMSEDGSVQLFAVASASSTRARVTPLQGAPFECANAWIAG